MQWIDGKDEHGLKLEEDRLTFSFGVAEKIAKTLLWLALPDKFIWHLLYNSTRAFFVWVKGTK